METDADEPARPVQNGVDPIVDGLIGGGDDREEAYEEDGGIRIGDIYIPPPPPAACTFDPTGPRLVISEMAIEGFKSYAKKTRVGPFYKNFTCIIGPNGSGKSNVIDAMLFVFGYRSQRIRSKKLSGLVHQSDECPNCNSCTVAVHFCKIVDKDNDEFEEVPGSRFVVSRTAYKDDSSYYTLDGKKLKYKEVAKFLRGQGVDLDHNRFLILQGEVEHIAMMKPKGATEHDMGMLEFLEDIIGSNRLKVPLELLSQQVEELNEKKTQKLERVKLVEKDVEDLRKTKDEAMSYVVLENEIARKKNVALQKNILTMSEEKGQLVDLKKKCEEEISNLEKDAAEMKASYETMGKEYKQAQSECDEASKKHDAAVSEFTELERLDLQYVEGLKHSRKKWKTLSKSVASDKKKLEELMEVPSNEEGATKTLKEKLSKLHEGKKEKEENLANVMATLKEQTRELQKKKDTYEQNLLGLQTIVDQQKSAMGIAQSQVDIYKSTEKKEAELLEKLRKDHENCVETSEKKTMATGELQSELNNLQENLTRETKEFQGISAQTEAMTERLRTARMKTQEAKDSMQSNRSRSKVLQYILDLKAQGTVQGILGRLGDLGAIDSKYDVAISAACGYLDHILVESEDVAEECIRCLKRDAIGRADFIALNKMRTWEQYVRKPLVTPENVPRLFDLLTARDDRYLPAFYFAVRDTLVVGDLTQGTRIAFGPKRFRVVTVKGHVIDQSGAMTGGGSEAPRSLMGSKVTACEYTSQQIANMEVELRKLEEESDRANGQRAELARKIESAQMRVPQLAHQLKMNQIEISSLADEMKKLKPHIAQQENQVKLAACNQEKLQELQTILDEAIESHRAATSDAAKVQEKVKKLDGQIMEITGGQVKAAQKPIDEVSKQIDETQAAITKSGVAVKTAVRETNKLDQKIKNAETEMEELKKKVETFEAQCKTNEVKAKKLCVDLQEIKSVLEGKKREVANLRKEWEVLQEKQNLFSSKCLKIQHEIEKYDVDIQKCEDAIHKYKRNLEALKLQETDEETDLTLAVLPEEELREVDKKALMVAIVSCENELAKMKPNPSAIIEFKKKEAVFLQRVKELEEITEERNTKRNAYEELKTQRMNEFMKGFTTISTKLKETYQMITLGGDAELELVNSMDPFSEGIVFTVRPPKKSWKRISNLSGGEKTISSLALVFALHYYKPTPLYVMDEIDAALDVCNVSIIGHYIMERTKNAQFVVISLRENMFELANRLVGIYKTYNCTKTVILDLRECSSDK